MRWWQWVVVTAGLVLVVLGGVAMFQRRPPPLADSTPSSSSPGTLAVLVDEAELRPGLLAVYRSTNSPDAGVTRIDAKPAFTWGDSSPHPRLGPGPFEVTWTGILDLHESEPIRFSAYLGGQAKVIIDGATVFDARNDTATLVRSDRVLQRAPGLYRLRIDYRSLPNVPARLQLWWEAAKFSREPLPAVRLKHIPDELPAALSADQATERGRRAADSLGCARCHHAALPGLSSPPPGPALTDLGRRVSRDWLLAWLADPAKLKPGAHMPVLFSAERTGLVERWLVTEYLRKAARPSSGAGNGDHRKGRELFLGLGCAACHLPPDDRITPADPERISFHHLGDRFTPTDLAAFLSDPKTRYPDGRMPRFPLDAKATGDLAAFLLMWSKPITARDQPMEPVADTEIADAVRRLNAETPDEAAVLLLRSKGCVRCHPGLEPQEVTASLPIARPTESAGRGCLGKDTLPRFRIDAATNRDLLAYLHGAEREAPTPFARRQEQLQRAGCIRCHPRDNERTAPLEAIGRKSWSAHLARMPFQRTPALDHPCLKYTRSHLLTTLRDGVADVRPRWYSYRMPAFGTQAEELLQALAEADGDLPEKSEPARAKVADPSLPALGPVLAGAQGYGCSSCHVWNGKSPEGIDPGSVGPELTSVTQRIRKDWFVRWLDDPLRVHPGTPMPAIFRLGQPASITSILSGDAAKQKEALWAYLTLGKEAPAPTPMPPIPIATSADSPLVAQVPIQSPDGKTVESLTILYPGNDLLLYDLGSMTLRNIYTAARILRHATAWRSFSITGTPMVPSLAGQPPLTLVTANGREIPAELILEGYQRLPNGALIRSRARFASATVAVEEILQLPVSGERVLERTLRYRGIPKGAALELQMRPGKQAATLTDATKTSHASGTDGVWTAHFLPGDKGNAGGIIRLTLPHAETAPALPPVAMLPIEDAPGGSLTRPGYRAIAYPRPKTSTGEDRLMPGAIAAHPRDGRVFIASMKLGELFVLNDPHDNGTNARFDDFAHGLFQEAYSLLAEDDALYVLHRRNLTRIPVPVSGPATRFDRAALLPHGISNAYDWGYGLVRDPHKNFMFTYAPHASRAQPGAGNLLRMRTGPDGVTFEEVAFGFRNPYGWCTGPDGEIFFTDNQGEWVATNKLCHIVPGRYYGYPNREQRQHATKPPGKPTVWVPYGWARSLNGVTYDASAGKFGPFAGQFFLAELMHGGAVIRAQVEKVNGEYQGACFPFWGRGLIGPLVLTFDPRGRLFVGGITQPGWMGQPDRGGLFRIDYIGPTPFEIQSIHVRPQGFRLQFTTPVNETTARAVASYRIEHYRYEYTGAYGSPELERTRLPIERIELQADGRSVELTTAALVKDRVYMIAAEGVRSRQGESLVHPTGAYTLNEIPR